MEEGPTLYVCVGGVGVKKREMEKESSNLLVIIKTV
jgi:hypothetical protein